MRVISLYQPYATLAAAGLKRFETRHWDTKVRGPLGIHATKSTPAWCKPLMREQWVRDLLVEKGIQPDKLPVGAIVGRVELISTLTTEAWLKQAKMVSDDAVINARNYQEYKFGDYTAGRYAWRLENADLFDTPIPAKGSQGFWMYDDGIINAYTGQLPLFGRPIDGPGFTGEDLHRRSAG